MIDASDYLDELAECAASLKRARAELVKATLLLVLCTACAGVPRVPPAWTPTPSLLVQARRVLVPWPEWLAGYAGAEVCSGKRGDVRRVRWYLVPGESFALHPGGQRLLGMTSGDDIFLAEAVARWIWLSRHEGLHHVRAANHTNHPPALFVGRCAADWPAPRDTL